MTDTLHMRANAVTGRPEIVVPVSETVVSEYCGNLIAQCEQKRIAIARRAAATLADLRTQINRIDHWLARDAGELARETAAAKRAGDEKYHPPFPPAAYWIIAVLVSVLEVFINKSAMDGLGLTDEGSWAAALMFSACLFLLSKLSGQALRQQTRSSGEWGGVAIGALFHIAMVLAVLHFAEARSFMAAQLAAAEGLKILEGGEAGFVALVLLGYGVMLFASYRNTPPSAGNEQRIARIEALRAAVDSRWEDRVKLARGYNTILAEAHHDLAALLQDLAERSYQFRCGVKRGGLMPSYFQHALPLNAVKPIHLGQMIDPQPESIASLVGKNIDSDASAAAVATVN